VLLADPDPADDSGAVAVCAGVAAGGPPGDPDGLAEAGLSEAGLAEAGLSEAGLAEDGLAEDGLVGAGLAGAGELGASCAHAAMTTRSLAGSALPPMPLRSTK
jgi:hypothetical protein